MQHKYNKNAKTTQHVQQNTPTNSKQQNTTSNNTTT